MWAPPLHAPLSVNTYIYKKYFAFLSLLTFVHFSALFHSVQYNTNKKYLTKNEFIHEILFHKITISNILCACVCVCVCECVCVCVCVWLCEGVRIGQRGAHRIFSLTSLMIRTKWIYDQDMKRKVDNLSMHLISNKITLGAKK